MTQSVGSMNQPVPVSLNEVGVMDWTPPPQLRDTSAETSEMMRTVAGLARRLVSWTDSPCWARAGSTQPAPISTPRSSGKANRRIIGVLLAILYHEGSA